MALKDATTSRRRWSGDIYPKLRRFLNSNIGKNWNKLYSKICAVAPANTKLGSEIRQAVEQEVNTKGSSFHYSDHYVDEQGILRLLPKVSWKTRYKKARESLPIVAICFKGDGNDTWYALTHVEQHYDKDFHLISKSKNKYWFQFTRQYIDKTRPVFEYTKYINVPRPAVIPALPSKQIGVKAYVIEEVHKRQCNGKEVKALNHIASRQGKIIRLVQAHDANGLTAYVAGQLGKE